MKGIETLIKVQKRELDERAKKIAECEAKIIALNQSLVQLQAELEQEKQAVEAHPHTAFTFGPYAENNRKRQQETRQSVIHLERYIQVLQEEMRGVFGELKKYEIALDSRRKAQAREAARQEGKRLDDMAINRHRKN